MKRTLEQNDILFKCSPIQFDFDFMDDIDITTIFLNLLDNTMPYLPVSPAKTTEKYQ